MMKTFSEFSPDARWGLIPDYMQGGLVRWIDQGVTPGEFLCALLKNDFLRAVGTADENNLLLLREYAQFLYCYAPTGSYGSEANFRDWGASGGLQGQANRQAAE